MLNTKKFLAVLNKITPERFDILANQVDRQEIGTKECLREIVDLIIGRVCMYIAVLVYTNNAYLLHLRADYKLTLLYLYNVVIAYFESYV